MSNNTQDFLSVIQETDFRCISINGSSVVVLEDGIPYRLEMEDNPSDLGISIVDSVNTYTHVFRSSEEYEALHTRYKEGLDRWVLQVHKIGNADRLSGEYKTYLLNLLREML